MAYVIRKGSGVVRTLSATEAAYLAGLFDGEGTFSLVASKTQCKPGGTPRRSHYFRALAHIDNTSEAMIDWLLETTGTGTVGETSATERTLAIWRWKLYHGSIRELVPQVIPYLVVKRRRAEILLEFISLSNNRYATDADASIIRSVELYDEIRVLNKRGGVTSPSVEVMVRDRIPMPPRGCVSEGCDGVRYPNSDDGYCYRHWLENRDPVWSNCERCGVKMDKQREHKRFCSTRCQTNAYYHNVRLPSIEAELAGQRRKLCPGCSKYFQAKPANKEYCSVRCHHNFRNACIFAREHGLPEPSALATRVYAKDLGFERTCSECGGTFKARSPKASLCSFECKRAAKNRNARTLYQRSDE